MSALPERAESAQGPKANEFLRGCHSCNVSMMDVYENDRTLRGLWETQRGMWWFCSRQCKDASYLPGFRSLARYL